MGSKMSFSSIWQQLNWDDLRLNIYSKTAQDVERALSKTRCDLSDFQALISPAAESYLEQLAIKAQERTRQRFGHTMGLYVPLYLSNLCANSCTYCGFSMENKLKRKVLNTAEIEQECQALKRKGFDSILLVTGEHETKVGMTYLAQAVEQIKPYFSYLALEVQPLEQEEYVQLRALGLNGVMVYQETYHQREYAKHHLRGKKQDFHYRLETADRLAQAGIDKIGLGALIGLEDWRVDSFFVARHLQYLEQRYWQSRYSISFPRLRPCTGGVEPKSVMTDRQLVQLICAYRLFNGEVELSLSTRESAFFRDNVASLGITTMSAESKTQPGGYAEQALSELEQFTIDDARSVQDVAARLQQQGLTPVWKDWQHQYH
ncbi:thiazole biosynthesis protein ThiH [Photobacterium damselae subsp. damselae CIP 102761]|uniref:Thiazole biosynthesis protein ThiH n=3 Tax=Photobacterium damselae TaxID=38293 RepID=D0Z161_PHODD|nr:thiazole biosynthesis protein ThiH [Photobacterium damselae subsp. damselae CIP 102761]SPY45903.1 2-iminoacetate synthase [Photobacterium damselae]